MDRIRAKSHLELATNVAVLVVSVAVLGSLAWRYIASAARPRFPAGLQKGQIFESVPGLNYRLAPHNLIVALSTKCQSCEETVTFLNSLINPEESNPRTQIVAVFPESKGEVQQYIEHSHLLAPVLVDADYNRLRLGVTPTVILLDNKGEVLDFWTGKTSQAVQTSIVKALR